MSNDDQSPATKKDIAMIVEMIERGEERFARFEGEMGESRTAMGELRAEIKDVEERMKTHFDLAVETIRYDLVGANKDEIQGLKTRVDRLEHVTGIAA